jgi:hypothetical protein
MATYAVRQVPPQSLDTAGISVATTTTDTADPRQGQMYDPTTLAAAAPVWFHRIPDGRYLGLFSRHLHTATVAQPQTGGPLLYSGASESYLPTWAIFSPASGTPARVETIPTEVDGERTLTSATSRGDYLFVLSTIGDEALLQHFRIGTRREATLVAEEVVPSGLGLGLYLEGNDLWLFGPVDGKLTVARKNWGRIGENRSVSPFYRWRYHTTRGSRCGWSPDPADLTPLDGDIPTSGPVSVARYRMRYYLTMPVWTPPTPASGTAPEAPGHWDARTWTNRSISRRWSPHPFTVPLGDGASYLGGTAYLQPQLPLTRGYTSTRTERGETVLDAASDHIQVFTGLASQIVRLPGAGAHPYTLYNQTPSSDLPVVTAEGMGVTTVPPGEAVVCTPASATPVTAQDWTITVPAARTPVQRAGFPYVSTVRRNDGGNTTMVTGWGVLQV